MTGVLNRRTSPSRQVSEETHRRWNKISKDWEAAGKKLCLWETESSLVWLRCAVHNKELEEKGKVDWKKNPREREVTY